MDKYEFSAIGYMLFGGSWKKDMTRSLGLSERSRTVDKIASGERPVVSEGIKDDVIHAMKRKIEMLNQTIQFYEKEQEQAKVPLFHQEFSIVSFDIDGVNELSAFDEFSVKSEVGILFMNTTLNQTFYSYEFYSLIIMQKAEEALEKGDQSILWDAVQKYFSVDSVGRDNIKYLDINND